MVLPLGDVPDKRAGRDPRRDGAAYPPGGPCVEGVTGETVCIRRAPDLDALRRCAPPAHKHDPERRLCMAPWVFYLWRALS